MAEIIDHDEILNEREKALLQRLKGVARLAVKKRMSGGYSQAKVILADVWKSLGDHRTMQLPPKVFKIDTCVSIDREINRWQSYVKGTLPFTAHIPVEDSHEHDGLACIEFSFSDEFVAHKSFREFYTYESEPFGLIDYVFSKIFCNWQHSCDTHTINPDQTLKNWLGGFDEESSGKIKNIAEFLKDNGIEPNRPGLYVEELSRTVPNPLFLLKNHKCLTINITVPWGIIHGDLNAENILVSEKRECRLIDFYHTCEAEGGTDHAKLESVIKFELLDIPEDASQIRRLLEIENHLTADMFPFDSANVTRHSNAEVQKAMNAIKALRECLANFLGRFPHIDKEIHWLCLFSYALTECSYKNLKRSQRIRALISAAMIAEKHLFPEKTPEDLSDFQTLRIVPKTKEQDHIAPDSGEGLSQIRDTLKRKYQEEFKGELKTRVYRDWHRHPLIPYSIERVRWDETKFGVEPTGGIENLDEAMKDRKHWVVLGEAGSGKTTLLEKFLIEAANTFPILADSRNSSDNPVEIIQTALVDFSLEISPDVAKQGIEAGLFSILIDGFEERSKTDRERMLTLCRSPVLLKTPIVVVARETVYTNLPESQRLPRRFGMLRIRAVSANNIASYIKKRIGDEASMKIAELGGKRISEIFRTPLSLDLFARRYSPGQPLPRSKFEILQHFFKGFFDEWEKRKGFEHLESDMKTLVLTKLARFFFDNDAYQSDTLAFNTALRGIWDDIIRQRPYFQKEKPPIDILVSNGLITQRGEITGFSIPIFRDYFLILGEEKTDLTVNGKMRYAQICADLDFMEKAKALYLEAGLDTKASLTVKLAAAVFFRKEKEPEKAERILKTVPPSGNPVPYQVRALVLKDLRRFDEAEEQFKNGIKADPKNAPLYQAYALMLKDMGRFEEAETQFENGIKADPKNAPLYQAYALMLKDMGRFEEAETQFENGIKADPKNAPSYQAYALMLKDLGQFDEAETQFENGIKADPKHAPSYQAYALMLKDLGRFDEAETQFENGIKADPKHAPLYQAYARMLKDLGQFDEAEKQFENGIKADPKHAPSYQAYALMLKDLGRFDEAEKQFENGIKADPKHAPLYQAYALMLKDLGRFDEAAKMMKSVLKIKPDHRSEIIYLNLLFYCLNQVEEAKPVLEKLQRNKWIKGGQKKNLNVTKNLMDWIQTDAMANSDATLNISRLRRYAGNLIQNNNHNKAVEILRELCRQDPSDFSACLKLGRTLIRMGDNDGVKFLEKALDIQPVPPMEMFIPMLYSAIRVEHFEWAKIQVEAALNTHPENPELMKLQGILLRKTGHFKPAEEMFSKALNLAATPESRADILRNLAKTICDSSGSDRYDHACCLVERAWALEPANTHTYFLRRQILDKTGRSGTVDNYYELMRNRLEIGDVIHAKIFEIKNDGDIVCRYLGLRANLERHEPEGRLSPGDSVTAIIRNKEENGDLTLTVR